MNTRRRPQPGPRTASAPPRAAQPKAYPGTSQQEASNGAASPADFGLRPDPEVSRDQLQVLLDLMAAGGLDAHLTTIQTAIRQRHQEILRTRAHLAIASINVRDRVRLNQAIRPLYLHGETGTVVRWAGQSVIVELDNPVGRYGSSQIRCPPLGLEVLP